MTVLAEGLEFPEGPLPMSDGSLLFVEIKRKTVSRLGPDGKVSVVVQLEGGPNGLEIGPDGAVYIANDGGRFSFVVRDGVTFPGAPPQGFTGGGSIQRLDLKTGAVTTVFDSFQGKPLIAPDDLVFDRDGGMWITEFGLAPGAGALYYAARGAKSLTLARGGLSGPNGIGFSPDGKLLHVSMGRQLFAFDVIGPGQLAANTYPDGVQAPLYNGGVADSLKVLADGRVCVCTLFQPGGIGVTDRTGKTEFFGFPDRLTCNLAFGGKDMRDCWLTLSGTGRIAKVRWPAPGLKQPFNA